MGFTLPKITFVEANGESVEVDAELGASIMQSAVDNGVTGIAADCGGALACATCHCYLDEQALGVVGEASGMEKEMLDMVESREANSRLSCQIEVSADLDGIVVSLPESQY